ncbi:MAG: hypothetical protein NTZ97_01685 [Candidatus Moranbacteria bacterium]|nr:hypothetical protein [Candidatus Moranbacteria bacterium]
MENKPAATIPKIIPPQFLKNITSITNEQTVAKPIITENTIWLGVIFVPYLSFKRTVLLVVFCLFHYQSNLAPIDNFVKKKSARTRWDFLLNALQ